MAISAEFDRSFPSFVVCVFRVTEGVWHSLLNSDLSASHPAVVERIESNRGIERPKCTGLNPADLG